MSGSPWERNEGKEHGPETPENFQYFKIYLCLGPGRGFASVATLAKISRQAISKTAKKFKWLERARAWDEFKIAQGADQEPDASMEDLLEQLSQLKPAEPPKPPAPPEPTTPEPEFTVSSSVPPPEPPGKRRRRRFKKEPLDIQVIQATPVEEDINEENIKDIRRYVEAVSQLGYQCHVKARDMMLPDLCKQWKELNFFLDAATQQTYECMRIEHAQRMAPDGIARDQNGNPVEPNREKAAYFEKIAANRAIIYARSTEAFDRFKNTGRQDWGDAIGVGDLLGMLYGKQQRKP